MMFVKEQMKMSKKFLSQMLVATCATLPVLGCGKADSETKSTTGASDLTGYWVLDCHRSNESYTRDMHSFTAAGAT